MEGADRKECGTLLALCRSGRLGFSKRVKGCFVYASMAMVNDMLARVLSAVADEMGELAGVLEEMPAPIYLTDADGIVTHFNRACVGFSGRLPLAGKDRWCVTWKLYTDKGEFLPHEQCPMATAIKSQQPVRGISAIAERPDGTRVNFMPFPTPIFGPSGDLTGAINVLIDVTDARQIAELRSQAQRCRRLARDVGDPRTAQALHTMAIEYEAKASDLERKTT
jgi:PAS domain-containing protein